MTGRFDDKVVMITGGGQGLGRAYAHRFADEGAFPVIIDINAQAVEHVAGELETNGHAAHAVACDITDSKAVQSVVDDVMAARGRMDVLINNASIFSTIKMQPFDEISDEEWRRVIDVNITGAFICSKAASAPMKQANWGRIINISSAAVNMGRANYLHYVTSKAGLIGMTRAMARELGKNGITVNAILPGATQTEIERETVSKAQFAAMVAMRAIPRGETPDDLVGIAAFLASDDSAFFTGQCMTVDGGLTHL